MLTAAQSIIKKLALEPHPEGGYFKETYRSEGEISENQLPDVFKGNRNYSTCIYFLLTSETFSAFHKINQEEIWHFYKGDAIQLVMISEEGELSEVIIGNDIENGELPQFVVPKHYWFAAKVIQPESYALTGCTVAPGFDFKDFTLPTRQELIDKFPQHQDLITKFTHH
ncbi:MULTISPECIES: cupin domain-containing protein [Mesonia]|uniref:Uncharacterized protein n=1 Tax=Mesonia oceanica TaxID=2687242 RepID=A0AC61YCU7_9FLAO|nr:MULTISPECIES: cupin domain-containing protein [Mesonia]MAN27098.1 hypothetical protein [Mesonia sp.]MAQ41985.1 hypothetical protein [Mesonia sp.]MBJ97660.1 hypothetical protein [Flavobacteriaceae bacterium]VVV02085.1 hypothetical protein FVB9532_03381 [Mesonia oceanica]|tara:strand:- start:11584 stop:12090 length:507 start_codon:yes stop_codon:yes gene_type:complete